MRDSGVLKSVLKVFTPLVHENCLLTWTIPQKLQEHRRNIIKSIRARNQLINA